MIAPQVVRLVVIVIRLVIQPLLQLQILMKKIENVNDQIDIDIQNLYMHIVMGEKHHYDGNVMCDTQLNQKMIKLG